MILTNYNPMGATSKEQMWLALRTAPNGAFQGTDQEYQEYLMMVAQGLVTPLSDDDAIAAQSMAQNPPAAFGGFPGGMPGMNNAGSPFAQPIEPAAPWLSADQNLFPSGQPVEHSAKEANRYAPAGTARVQTPSGAPAGGGVVPPPQPPQQAPAQQTAPQQTQPGPLPFAPTMPNQVVSPGMPNDMAQGAQGFQPPTGQGGATPTQPVQPVEPTPQQPVDPAQQQAGGQQFPGFYGMQAQGWQPQMPGQPGQGFQLPPAPEMTEYGFRPGAIYQTNAGQDDLGPVGPYSDRDDMSDFQKAFANARHAGMAEFSFKSGKYHTKTEEEMVATRNAANQVTAIPFSSPEGQQQAQDMLDMEPADLQQDFKGILPYAGPTNEVKTKKISENKKARVSKKADKKSERADKKTARQDKRDSKRVSKGKEPRHARNKKTESKKSDSKGDQDLPGTDFDKYL